MKIAIYARSTKDNISEYVKNLLKKLQEKKVELFIYEPFYHFLKQNQIKVDGMSTFSNHQQLASSAKYLLSLGGDGTFLETLSLVRDSGLPVLGINTGRLGFLANVSKDEIDLAIEDLINKKFSIDKRTLLKLETKNKLFGEVNYSLNEITIVKKDSTMMTIHTYIDGEFLNSYWADGLIVSTPTGSTAYSLSCGGPIVVPDAKNFIVTPIAPHNLNVRPIILSDDKVLSFKIEGRSPDYLVTLDSRSENITPDIEMIVRKESFYIHLIRLENISFFNTLRHKLMWGADRRENKR